MNNSILKKDTHYFANHFELAEELRNKSFLITGATGLIGSVLIKCLVELNYNKNLGLHIIAIVRDLKKAKSVFLTEYEDIEFIQLSVTDINESLVFPDVDYIVHLASPTASKYFVTNPVETLSSAFMGTNNILKLAKVKQVKSMVYASSLEVYGSNFTDDWILEDFQGYINPIDVRSSYSQGKRACECLCHSYAEEYDVPVAIARLTQTFGPGINDNDNRVFAQFSRSVIEGKDIELHTNGNSSKPYCYTLDSISAIVYLLLRGSTGESYNIANKESYISIRELANFIRDKFNPNINVLINIKDNMGYAPETRLRLDTSKMEALGWKAQYDLYTMFLNLIEYLK